MKSSSLRSIWESIKRRISVLVIISMIITSLSPATSVFATSYFTDEKYQFVDEVEVEETLVNEGMFYIPHSHLEANENAENNKYVFKVLRKGASENAEQVKLTMMDITGKYDKDYKIKVIDKAFFSETVQNIHKSQSILEYAQKNEVEEYNYSDAIIDGTIDSEDIMSEDEKENFKMSDEDKEKALTITKEMLDEFGIDAQVDGVGSSVKLNATNKNSDNENEAENYEAENEAENKTDNEAVENDADEADLNDNNTLDEPEADAIDEKENANENDIAATNDSEVEENNVSNDDTESDTTEENDVALSNDETVSGFTKTDTSANLEETTDSEGSQSFAPTGDEDENDGSQSFATTGDEEDENEGSQSFAPTGDEDENEGSQSFATTGDEEDENEDSQSFAPVM